MGEKTLIRDKHLFCLLLAKSLIFKISYHNDDIDCIY